VIVAIHSNIRMITQFGGGVNSVDRPGCAIPTGIFQVFVGQIKVTDMGIVVAIQSDGRTFSQLTLIVNRFKYPLGAVVPSVSQRIIHF